MTGQQTEEEWFLVLEGPWGREDQPDEDPEVPGVPGALLARVRELVPTWRSLGIDEDDTVGCYENGRLRLGIELGDRVQVAVLRVEFSAQDWAAAWADATDGITAPTMTEAKPLEPPVGGPIRSADGSAEIDQAVDWLQVQLRRPIRYDLWREGGEIVGELWRLTGPDVPLARSGEPRVSADPSTATESRQIRP